jgi:hypothetical protein
MGSGASTVQIVKEVEAYGDAYKVYVPFIKDNGINGEILENVKDFQEEILNLIENLQNLHKMRFQLEFERHFRSNKVEVKTEIKPNESENKKYDTITLTPKDIMSGVFGNQGIHCDIKEYEKCAENIYNSLSNEVKSIPTSELSENEYHLFIGYRVATDQTTAEFLYTLLTFKYQLKVFWDVKCLKAGESWKSGFLNALPQSKCFIALISVDAHIKTSRNFEIDHSYDNVLIELEYALDMMKRKSYQYLFPILIGKYIDSTLLQRFRDFDENLYSDRIVAW